MDISRSITYRGLDLNGVSSEQGSRTLRGIAVESVDYSNVDAVGYTEKRAGADGMHASDVYLGARRVEMTGHVYAVSLAELFDYLHVLRSVFSPTSAYQQSPGDRGFLPMSYFQPTGDIESFPEIVMTPPTPNIEAGIVPMYMNLRPERPVRYSIARDRLVDNKKRVQVEGVWKNGAEQPTATTWAAQLIAKDPRVYVANPTAPGAASQIKDMAGAPTAAAGVAGEAINRGDYETPLNVTLVTTTAPPANSKFRVTGFGGADMTISLEAKANQVYRWFGDDRALMVQDVTPPATQATAPLVLRMDLVTFAGKNRRPMVPAAINPPDRPFKTTFTYYRTLATLAAGSRLFWSEAFA